MSVREMKDSGIEWIGEIPDEWEIRRNKTLFDCSKEIVGAASGKTQLLSLTTQGVKTKSPDAVGGKVPDSFDTYQIVMPNDIVMCLFDLDCSAVFSGISPYHGMISPAYKIIKCNSDILPRFADYWFRFVFDGRKFKSYAKNIRYTLNYDEFATLPFVVPIIREQERIITYLDEKCAEIDAVIAKTKATIEEYKKLKQAIITQAVTKGIRGDRPMKDSGVEWIGEIPTDWNRNSIKNVATTCSGGTPNSGDETLYDGDINWICSYDLKEKPIFESGRKITQKGADSIAGKMQSVGSILIAMYGGSGTIGNSGILECEARTNQAICSIKFNNKYLIDYYGFYYILAIRKHWMIYAVGTRKDPNISQDIVKRMPCIIPPLAEQVEIIDYLNKKCAQMDTLIAKKTALLEEMESYKKSVIYEYVTGKKSVEEVQQAEMASIVYPYFPAQIQGANPRFAQAVLMSRILDTCRTAMGRVKLEKMLYTIETSIGFDFNTEYERAAAGPLDSSVYECERIISRNNKWFTTRESSYGVSYSPTDKMDTYKKYYERYFGDYDAEISHIIEFFREFRADQAEIVATLFGAWNDAVIDGKAFNDDDIVDDVLNNWNDSKKRFSKDVWLRAMQQMRENGIVPKGYGKKTVAKI